MFLEKLSNASGVSGNEKEVRQILKDEISQYVDEIYSDSMGNLFAIKKGNEKKVMITAHMDEIGLFVDMVENNGYVRFKKIGGIDDRVLLSKKVYVGENKNPGIIGMKPIHLQTPSERGQNVIGSDDMYIDMGLTGKDEKLVKVGDTAVFATQFSQSGDILMGKAFDDRAGCAVLTELLKKTYPFTLYGVFTVQEESGLRGAKIAAYHVNPDFAFVLEGTTAGDTPTKRDISPSTNLGAGPAITIMDRATISNRGLVNLLVDTANKEKIPYQFKRTVTGGTDAGVIHLTHGGIPTVTVSVPVRYIHTPVSLMRFSDFQNTIELMHKTLLRLTEFDDGGLINEL
ncbi:MAG: M42 family metallopeptidase [bacterium]